MAQLFWRPAMAHFVAMICAFWFAWTVSSSAYATTSIQFVAPLLVIMGVHVLWLAGAKALRPGYAQRVYARSVATAAVMIGLLFLGTVFAPLPANAQSGEAAGMLLVVVGCVLFIALVIGAAGLLVWSFAKLMFWAFDRGKGGDGDDPDERLNDGASLFVAAGLVVFASTEGVTDTLTFPTDNHQAVSYLVDAPADVVWQTMQTATSPVVPLPAVLQSFPQPIAVTTDQGTYLGSKRVVAFQGREGAGALSLEVVAQTQTRAVFEVLSDTTPYANWIGYDQLTYDLQPAGDKTRLTVSLAYERRLSPAWFFEPVMAGAASLAMDVLATDVKTRAENAL